MQLQIKQQKEQEVSKHPSRPAAAAYINTHIYIYISTRADTSKTGECQGGPEGGAAWGSRWALGLGAWQHQIWDWARQTGKTDRFKGGFTLWREQQVNLV